MGANNSRNSEEFIAECKKKVRKEVSDYPITIFTRSNDEPSHKAMDLLIDQGFRFKEKDLQLIYDSNHDTSRDLWNGLVHETGRNVTPHIFVCGNYIGGYKELNELVKEKELLGAVRECWMQYDNNPQAKFQ
uniref:Glutaredoxin domain-containing protein n=1 Tax=Acrobeloides nanus TaxID=290746 RepID=A0A914CA47_9BILA